MSLTVGIPEDLMFCILCGDPFKQVGSEIVCPNHTRLSIEDTREALSVIELAEKAMQDVFRDRPADHNPQGLCATETWLIEQGIKERTAMAQLAVESEA